MISIRPIDFLGQGALLEPAHPEIHDAAYEFIRHNLRDWEKVDFSKFAKVWVGYRDDEVKGVMGYVLRPDVPLMRVIDPDVLRAMSRRFNDFLADNGWRNGETFIYIGNESPEQRCPEWRQVLKEFGARSGRRVLVEVK